MKINLFNIHGETNKANNALGIILAEAINDLETKDGIVIEDIKLEELNATFTFKPAGQDDYMVLSVEHDGASELLEIDYDLKNSELDDNSELSVFSGMDREIIRDASERVFETVEPFLDDSILEYQNEEIIGDMRVVRFKRLDTGQEAVRVFQKDRKSTQERLIQEYSIKNN